MTATEPARQRHVELAVDSLQVISTVPWAADGTVELCAGSGFSSPSRSLEQATLRLLRAVGVRMLVIDELHNVLAGSSDRRREFLNLIRFLTRKFR
jgi:hypothetical protein